MLAFACAFTMFAGAASFTDQADIAQTEAVDMLAALNVIKGYEDGSYRPDEIVTRAEMAKMIYVIRNGGSDVVTQYEGYTTPFTDVENVNHWAKGYIAYCYANGIIAGKSATKFDPDAPVTGQEAAKMALVLIGYDPERAGLEGASWAANTTNLATQKDLFDDYTVSITAGAPRQFAAQLLYNTLWAGTVRWSDDANGYEDVTSYNYDDNGVVVGLAYVTVAKRYMGLEEEIGWYQGDSKINTGLKSNESMFDGKIITFVPENGNDWLGESVKVLYKNSKDGTTDAVDRYDTIYGMTLSGETSTVAATLGDIGDDSNGKIDVNGTKYELADASFNVNEGAVADYVGDNAENFTDKYTIAKDTANKIFATDNGFKQDSADEVKFVLNRSGKIIDAYITHVNFYKVTGLTSTKISLAGLGTLDIDDTMTLADDVAVNDIVAMTTMYNGDPADDDAYNIIEKATVVSGVKVSNMKSGTEVMINDSYAKYAKINDCVTTADSNYKASVELDGTYDFVMYGDYWVAAKKVSASSKDIALVTGADSNGLEDRVKVMTSDGSETVYTYDDNDGDGAHIDYIWNGGALTNNKLFSFTLVGDNKIQLTNGHESTTPAQDGGKAVTGLTFVLDATKTGDGDDIFFNDETKSITVDKGQYVSAEDAVAYVTATTADGTDTYVYNIDDMKTLENENVTGDIEYVLNDDNQVVALYVETDVKPGATASNDQYGYIIDNPASSSADGTKYVELKVWNGTDTVVIKIESSSVDSGWEKGAFIKFTVGSDGLTDKADVKVLTSTGAVQSYNRGLLTLYAATGTDVDSKAYNTYAVADDVVIIGVNTKDKELVEGISAVPQAFVDGNNTPDNFTDDNITANILYALDDDGKVAAIFVDTNNDIKLP